MGYTRSIRILRCSGLEDEDPFGGNDPYVEVKDANSGETLYKTSVKEEIDDKGRCCWKNASVELGTRSSLELVVWDEDITSDDVLGAVKVEVPKYAQDGETKLQLKKKDDDGKEANAGFVVIEFDGLPQKPEEKEEKAQDESNKEEEEDKKAKEQEEADRKAEEKARRKKEKRAERKKKEKADAEAAKEKADAEAAKEKKKEEKQPPKEMTQEEKDKEVLRKLDSYPRHDDILNHPYKLLSTSPRAPTAPITGKRKAKDMTIKPGPGSYELGLSWTKGTGSPRMRQKLDISLKPAPVDTLTDLEYKTPKGKAFSMSSKHSEGNSREQKPGPTSYHIASFTDKYIPLGKEREKTGQSTFGVPHPPKKYSDNPGPGAYEHIPTKTVPKNFRKAPSVRSIPKAPPQKLAPGPGAYDIPSTFGPQHGALTATIKGRLAHPMFDKNAVHESAKTSSPRSFEKRMKAIPRCK